MVPVITIDGPTASGKGTIARQVALALGFRYLDSGALYRLTAFQAERQGVRLEDEPALAALAERLPVSFDQGRIQLGGEDVTDRLRTESLGIGASRLSVFASVRAALLGLQRDFRQPPGLVADGRDMGTAVFPDAQLKVFLTASAESRAERRLKQLNEKGFSAKLATLLQDLLERDARDSSRAASPLRVAEGAFVIDSTSLTIPQTVQAVLDRWAARR